MKPKTRTKIVEEDDEGQESLNKGGSGRHPLHTVRPGCHSPLRCYARDVVAQVGQAGEVGCFELEEEEGRDCDKHHVREEDHVDGLVHRHVNFAHFRGGMARVALREGGEGEKQCERIYE